MKRPLFYRWNWAMSMALLFMLALSACTGQVAATQPPESSPVPEASLPPSEATAPPTSLAVETPVASEAPTDPNVLYQDDFTNPTTGWSVVEFDNYFIGYHEPESYHIEIKSPHLKAPVVPIPDAATNNFPDATIELQVQTVSGRTSTEGDYRYGLVFRRSGDQYYAFTISPTSKKWEVFKSSPSGIVPLKEGVEQNIHDLDVDDTLRVDASGSGFSFYINNNPVAEVTDSDYPAGEIGFYAENIENVNTHIHFGELTVREVKYSYMCNVTGGTLNVRSGPGKTFAQIGLLSDGDTVKALGISSNNWIKIVLEGSDAPGWVSYSDGFMSCTPTVDFFPIVDS